MAKCNLDDKALKSIQSKVAIVLRTYLKDKAPMATLKTNMVEILNKIADQYELSPVIIDTVLKVSERYGVVSQNPDFFNAQNLTNIILNKKDNIQQSNLQDISADRLVDTEQVQLRRESTREFLDNSYGLAKEVQDYVVNQTNKMLFDCLFINRGSLTNQALGIVKNSTDLNNNIRNYQQDLLNTICKYLDSVISKSPNLHVDKDTKQLLKNPVLYQQVSGDGTLENSGILRQIEGLVKMFLSPTNFSADNLRELLNTVNNYNIDPQVREEARTKLNAYNANVILTNFDSYLVSVLGKSIQIKDFNQKTGKDKYQIANSTANVFTTWRVNDDINIEEEADMVTKLAINTTSLYNWQDNTPQEGKFIKFQDFSNIIAKIKDLVFSEGAYLLKFDDSFINNNSNIWNTLDEKTRELLKDKTLSQLINLIRLNPRQYLDTIFDILNNQDFYNGYSHLYKGFTDEELNKMYSLYKGVFRGPNSLYQLTKGNVQENDFYGYLTGTADAIFSIQYVQYFKNEKGVVKSRTFLDQSINNIQRTLETTIETHNTKKLIKDYNDIIKKFNINYNSEKNSLQFTIPNTTFDCEVSLNSGRVYVKNNNFIVNNYIDLLENEDIKKFIDSVIPLNLTNSDLINTLAKAYKGFGETSQSLLNFAIRVVANQYVSNKLITATSSKERENQIQTIYGKNAPDYNYTLDELGLVHKSDIRTLENIAKAKAYLDGVTSTSQVKDSQGNGQSTQTLSRLLGSFNSQYELQERNADSASRGFSIINIPGLLTGVYTTKEFYDLVERKSKSTTDMTVGELSYSSIVNDFIKGLIYKEDNTDLVGNGYVMFLPSVNSDKSTIGRMRVNLNKQITLNGVTSKLIDLNFDDIKSLISQELGTFYIRMFENIKQDLTTLDTFIKSQGFNIPSLSQDFINGYTNVNAALIAQGYNPIEFVKTQVANYNKTHRLHPLELIDQVHFKEGKEGLAFNNTIISQIARFQPQYLGAKAANYPSQDEFWSIKEREFLIDLLKANFSIDLTIPSEEGEFLGKQYPDWVNSSGKVILGKIKQGNNIVNITSLIDLVKNDLDINALQNVELHPVFRKFNYLEYFFTQEFMNSTVGSFVAHPPKGATSNILEIEAAQFNAQHKRNVSMTASMHPFQLNLLNGIPSEYNVAVIEDIKDLVGTIIGLDNKVKPFDGATFVNPFIVILENNSLGGAKAGITKKQFVHFKNERTGTGGIIKTAGFGLTNDWIRNSPFLEDMMRKMTKHTWLNEDGTEASVNIKKNYSNQPIKYKDMYFKQNGRFFKIVRIDYLGQNQYQRVIQEVNEDGSRKDAYVSEPPVTINNNYDLWNFFGGKNSMEIKNRLLQLSNTSVENVVIAMNNVASLDSMGNPIIKNNRIETQADLWQPLKQVDVHYVATAGAVKQGAANINSASKYYAPNKNNDSDYDIQRIHMYQSGIQLDKEHHADDSELSIMTQVISACAAKGYTLEAAISLYSALRKATELGTGDFLNALQEYFRTKDKKSIQEIVIKTLIDSLGSGSKISNNFAEIIASDLIKKAKNGEEIDYVNVKFPLSDNTVYAKICSIINSYLTNSGIKQKIPGILSVLTPSYNINRIFAGKKYEAYNNPKEELEILQNAVIPVFDINNPQSNISDLEIGRTYTITKLVPFVNELGETEGREVTESVLIRTPKEYRNLRRDVLAGDVIKVIEDITVGRDLAGYNVRFEGTTLAEDGLTNVAQRFQIWDLDSARLLADANDAKSAEELAQIYEEFTKSVPEDLSQETFDSYRKALKIRLNRMLQQDLINLNNSDFLDSMKEYEEFLGTYSADNPNWYKKYTNWVNIKLGRTDGNSLNIRGQKITVNAQNFNEVEPIVRKMLDRTTKVQIDGKLVNINRASIKTQPYELIMPKTFATAFGLSEFDSLEEISNNKYFFVEQYLKNQSSNTDKYTLEFKRSQVNTKAKYSQGNHLYLSTYKDLTKFSNVSLLPEIEKVVIDGRTYRLDSNGDVMYEITEDTKIYIDTDNDIEIIVSDNTQFYIDNLSYDSIKINSSLETRPSVVKELAKQFKSSSNKTANSFYRYISHNGQDGASLMQLNLEFHNITLENYKEFGDTHPIVKQGLSKHSSFLKSLDVVAARIPSQSQQSFMPMKIVAFDNPNINTAFVSTYQILLQGSDYDIDAVSLATYDINENGLLQLWSPYAQLDSIELINASMELPLPTGEILIIPEAENSIGNGLSFLRKYANILNINQSYTYNKDTKEFEENPDELDVTLNINTVEDLFELKEFLKDVNRLYKPSKEYYKRFEKDLGIQMHNPEKQIGSLFKGIQDLVDSHNLYFNKLSRQNLSRAINNHTMYSMFKVINNPINLIQAQTSVDGTTGPLSDIANNSPKGKIVKQRTAGNAMNKFYSIVENQVGKQAIGICAVGLKAFFGLTQYNNSVLSFGSEAQQRRLLLNSNHKGFIIGDKLYRTVANIRSKYINNLSSGEIMEALASVNNDTDAALILSALLSLATDNAKELALSKLNAGTKTIGMYIYGITIGMNFEDIANIMMSDVGEVMLQLMEGNVFTNEAGFSDMKRIFDYFDEGPKKQLKAFNINSDPNGLKFANIYKYFEKEFRKIHNLQNKKGKDLPFEQVLVDFAQSNYDLKFKLDQIGKLRLFYNNVNIYAKQKYNQLLDFIETYITQSHIIGQHKGVYKDFKTLQKGAEEMRRLGSIFSLNQGIKTNNEDMLNQIDLIEKAIYDITEDPADIIDLQQFVFDNDYRQRCISKYEEVKHSFNILDAVTQVPHFMGYLQTLVLSLGSLNQSFKFRNIKHLLKPASDTIGLTKESEVAKGIQNYIGDYLRKEWMRDVEIIIPENNSIFDEYGNAHPITSATPIKLGLDWTDASFKMFMEKQVIPDLKNGKIKPGINRDYISNNLFIKNLSNNLFTNTVSKNPSIVAALPINMLPRTDSERAIFNKYKSEFNKLSGYTYEYEVSIINEDGTVSKSTVAVPIVDLFTYYAMIANNWKLGEKSLVPILEDFQNQGIIESFHNFVDNYDKFGPLLNYDTIEDDLLPYIVPYKSPYSAYTNYILAKNPSTTKKQIMRRLTNQDEMQEENPGQIGNYEFIGNKELDISYFPTGQVQKSQRQIVHSVDGDVYRVSYKIEDGSITKLTVKGEEVQIPDLKNIPVVKRNGIKYIDTDLLDSIINNYINKC